MVNFTPTNLSSHQLFFPSERSLDFVRQYAYAWNRMKYDDQLQN